MDCGFSNALLKFSFLNFFHSMTDFPQNSLSVLKIVKFMGRIVAFGWMPGAQFHSLNRTGTSVKSLESHDHL